MTMKKPSIYVETSVFSYYFKANDPAVRTEYELTVQWWTNLRRQFNLFTSIWTLGELKEGVFDDQKEMIALAESIPLLSTVQDIDDIVDVYLRHFVMPKNDPADAFHLAYASFYKMDFLLTWNCAHIANPRKFQHIRIVNAKMGLLTPDLVTPYDMVKGA